MQREKGADEINLVAEINGVAVFAVVKSAVRPRAIRNDPFRGTARFGERVVVAGRSE